MSNTPYKIQEVQRELYGLENKKDFEQAQRVILSVIKLLDDSISENNLNLFQLFNDSDGKIRANASWFFEDKIIADRKATYKVHVENSINMDFKVYGVNKASKRVISWATALTPNFEDEPFNSKFNIGIDFIVPKSTDRVIIVLTNNYIIRTLELKGKLTATYQEILGKWLEIKDFSNKKLAHTALWESFDLQPLNKKFYAGISERFIILRQYLIKENILDEKHASMFANRLIGRVIFCWFLDKKGIINSKLEYFDPQGFSSDTEYYKTNLEKLFFGVLNTPIEEREYKDDVTPFLNGGLFEARKNDLYKDNKLSFPKNYFSDLFDFLSAYNFTTDESTSQFQQVAIDPEMLGRIFENLLAEISEETGEQARKAKGAFYTPREIVDYMCKESLKEYLKTKIPEDTFRDQRLYQLIDAPDKDFQDQDHNWRRDWKPYKDTIISALDDLKVLDPACGSGAFPIGMLQLLVRVYERLEPRFDDYKAKLQIIEKNIYGVDIEPMAVEISRLRTWLSIVVDEESDSKKIKPLPNLEFKFVCANSLIDLDKSGKTALYGEDPDLENKLRDIRDAYFNTESLTKKKGLKEKYEKLINTNNSLFGEESEKSKQLKTYRPFDNESSAIFFNSEFMFGVKKFNIIIENPPYIRASKIEKKLKPIYKNIFKTAYGSYDIYTLFFEKAFSLLDEYGVYCFITSNKFLIADYAKPLRELMLTETQLIKLLDLADCKRVFVSAFVSPAITLGRKDKMTNKYPTLVAVLKDDDVSKISSMPFIKTADPFSIHLINDSTSSLMKKIQENTIDLEKIADVRTGIMGFDYWNLEPFISDGYKKGSIRMITNGFIDQYRYSWGQKGRLYKKDFIEPYLDIENAKINKPTKELFKKKKIIIRGVAQKLSANIDSEGFGLLVAVHSAIINDTKKYNPKYILALLNSSLMNWVHLKKFYSARIPEGSLKYPISFIKKIPIKTIKLEDQKEIIKIVDLILSSKDEEQIKTFKKEIDEHIMDIYKLTKEEKEIIRNS